MTARGFLLLLFIPFIDFFYITISLTGVGMPLYLYLRRNMIFLGFPWTLLRSRANLDCRMPAS